MHNAHSTCVLCFAMYRTCMCVSDGLCNNCMEIVVLACMSNFIEFLTF